METFIENLTRNAVATASTNAEQNIYADALGAFRMLTQNQQKAFEIAYTAYQCKWYLSIAYKTEKAVSKETKANGIPFVVKHAKVVAHFENYQSLVVRASGNENFVAENRKWGVRINDVCVYHKGQLYLSMKPTWTNKVRYFVPTADGGYGDRLCDRAELPYPKCEGQLQGTKNRRATRRFNRRYS